MFESFKTRSAEAELMDDPSIDRATFADCLRDLASVNRLSLGYRPTLAWLRRMLPAKTASPLTLFDIGSGGGDMLRRVAAYAARDGKALALTGIDLNPWSKAYAETRASALPITYETVDIFDFPPQRQADYIITSLMTHHLPDDRVVAFLRWLDAHSSRGWLINDLHRHPLAWILIRYGARLLRYHYMVCHDGPVSVARAFTRADWLRYLAQAGIPADEVEIRWWFPFRYTVSRRKL